MAIDLFDSAIIIGIFILTYAGIIHSRVDKTIAAVLGGLFSAIAIIIFEMEDQKHHSGPIDY